MGYFVGFSTQYVLPLIAGFYVGVADGANAGLDHTTKYGLLAAPTVLNVGITAIANGLGKVIAKKASNYGVNNQAILSMSPNPTEVEQGLSKLENLANDSVAKKSLKAVIKPGITTSVGYALGYGCAKLFS